MVSISSLDVTQYMEPSIVALLRKRGILEGEETPKDLFERVVNSLLSVEDMFQTSSWDKEKLQRRVCKAISTRRIAFGSPLLTNIGREGKPTNSCTVIPVDLRAPEEEWKKIIVPYYRAEMGSGFNLSDVTDPVAVLLRLNQLMLSMEHEVKRPPAGMAILNVKHPKILEFVTIKKETDFATWRFNLSVAVTDTFMRAVQSDTEWTFQDGSKTSAVALFDAIVQAAHYCGEPGLLFTDAIERDNPVPSLQYTGVSPCAEIAMAPGEVCQFSYINLAEMTVVNRQGNTQVDFKRLRKTTALLTRLLDNAVEISIQNAVADPEIMAAKRRISVGICGFSELLVTLGISYDSKEALQILEEVMSTINYYSKKESVELGKVRGSFPAFSISRYRDPAWTSRFKHYPTEQVSGMMWKSLAQKIAKKGIRNAGTTAVPPTGVAARIIHASYSLEPFFTLWDSSRKLISCARKVLLSDLEQSGVVLERCQEIADVVERVGRVPDTIGEVSLVARRILVVATEIPFTQHIEMLTHAQRYVDESVSKTVNLPNSASVYVVRDCFLKAYQDGLKGMTVFRDDCLAERKRS